MIAAQKSESPAATGFNAKQNTNAAILQPAQKIGNFQEKRLSNLRALFALKGHVVQPLANGEFLVSRWGLTRHCWDFAALEAFARQVGAAS